MPTSPQPQESADRTARHMAMCAELADLGMQLARVTAARALAEQAEPEPPPIAEPLTTAAPDPPPASPPRRTPSQSAAARKPTDPAILFTRLAGVVRDCIALEARLATGSHASTRLSTLRTDPRRASLHEALRRATEDHPDRAEILRDATDRADEEIAADPEQSLGAEQIFFAICEDLGIEIDLATLSDEYIGLDYEPEPRATSPP